MIKKKIYDFKNRIKKKCLMGCWLQLPIHDIGFIINSNFDWYCLDLEHGLINFKDVNYMYNSLEKKKAPIFCRINISEIYKAPRLLDLGIDGLIIANTNNKKDLQLIKNYCFYPPVGNRSIGYAKSNNFSFKPNSLKFKPIIIPMIEKKEAVENLKTILEYSFIDGLFIGPVDLSASYSKFEKGSAKKIQNIINSIIKIAKTKKIPIGFHQIEPNNKKIKGSNTSKYNFIAYSTDSVILKKYYSI